MTVALRKRLASLEQRAQPAGAALALPVLDNSPDVLMRVVDVLVQAHAVPADVAAVLRGAGIEVSDDALGEQENAASSQLEEDTSP